MSQTLIVYLNAEKTAFHKITPDPLQFKGSWKDLAEAITGSNSKYGILNYHSFEVI